MLRTWTLIINTVLLIVVAICKSRVAEGRFYDRFLQQIKKPNIFLWSNSGTHSATAPCPKEIETKNTPILERPLHNFNRKKKTFFCLKFLRSNQTIVLQLAGKVRIGSLEIHFSIFLVSCRVLRTGFHPDVWKNCNDRIDERKCLLLMLRPIL